MSDFDRILYYARPEDQADRLERIAESLGDQFYEYPPSVHQQEILDSLKELATRVRGFFDE